MDHNPFQSPATETTLDEAIQPTRISGGLLVLAVWLAPGTLFSLLLVTMFGYLIAQNQLPVYSDAYQWIVGVSIFRAFLGVIAGPVALVLLFRRSRFFPWFLTVFWTANIGLHFLFFGGQWLYWSQNADFSDMSELTMLRAAVVLAILAVGYAIWIPYCFRSKRARRTLVH